MEVVRRTCIVILEIQERRERQEIGAVVDAVSAVVDIPETDVEPPPQFGAKLRADFISGMGRLGEKFVILLDVDRVLSVEELATLGGIVETRSSRPERCRALASARPQPISRDEFGKFKAWVRDVAGINCRTTSTRW
jgi:hypothetical protein